MQEEAEKNHADMIAFTKIKLSLHAYLSQLHIH
jgi:hypothetical protein